MRPLSLNSLNRNSVQTANSDYHQNPVTSFYTPVSFGQALLSTKALAFMGSDPGMHLNNDSVHFSGNLRSKQLEAGKHAFDSADHRVHYITFPDSVNAKAQIGHAAADIVSAQVLQEPRSVIIFPTGRTQEPMYADLRQRTSLKWQNTHLFHLDEYVPQPAHSRDGIQYPDLSRNEMYDVYLNKQLWQQKKVAEANRYYFADYFNERNRIQPQEYENTLNQTLQIQNKTGADLVILGIGENGHIAFLEPDMAYKHPHINQLIQTYNRNEDEFYQHNRSAHRIDLTQNTIDVNFPEKEKTGYARQAVTLGLDTILSAKHVLIVANSEAKRAKLMEALGPEHLNEAPTPSNPASYLRLHPNVTVLCNFDMNTPPVPAA